MIPALEGYSAAIFAQLGDDSDAFATVSSDLSAIDHLVATNPTLLSGITDTSVPGPARRAILADLLEGRVSAEARRLASFAAGAIAAPKVPIALAWLADRVRLVAADIAEEPATLGLHAAREWLGGFAAAVFEGVTTQDLDEIEDELFRFARIVGSTPALRNALADPQLPQSVRQGVAHQLLQGKVHPATEMLVSCVLGSARTRDLVGGLDWLTEETARARGWRLARIRAANEIDVEQREELSQVLGALTGGPVELQVVLDPSLLSGAIVDIGDLRVDATARGRLTEMREQLVPGGWEEADILRRPGSPGVTDQEGDRSWPS